MPNMFNCFDFIGEEVKWEYAEKFGWSRKNSLFISGDQLLSNSSVTVHCDM
jgi:hypothetical protein